MVPFYFSGVVGLSIAKRAIRPYVCILSTRARYSGSLTDLNISIGVATPWVADLDNDNVAIVVGLTADKQTGTIAVPVSLFESGTEGAIKTWITQQNIEHQKSANDVSGKEPDTGREREIQILHELLSRYPEEAVHHE